MAPLLIMSGSTCILAKVISHTMRNCRGGGGGGGGGGGYI